MKSINHVSALALVLCLGAVLFIAPAYAASSVVHDPTGDSASRSPYLDIVHAQVVEQRGQGTLFFMMLLAGPIPEAPAETALNWVFHVDTNPDTAPGGLYNEYVVRVRWTGSAFRGEVVDRTPLPSGPPTITPIPFSIDGQTVKLFAELTLLGNPLSFRWNAATRPSPPAAYLDFAPDGGCDPSPVGCGLATWTQ